MEYQSLTDITTQVQIDENQLCLVSGKVKNNSGEIKLEPLPLAFLTYLIQCSGEVISRQQLIDAVWENRQVSDDAIRRVVKKLREALNDDAKNPRFIKTVPLKGYTFIGTVKAKDPVKEVKSKTPFILASTILLLFLSVAVTTFSFTLESETDISITALTNISGSEINGDYHKALNTLIFIHRNNNDAPFSLYNKNLNTGLTHQLTFDDNSYFMAKFSPSGNRLLYSKNTPDGVKSYVSDYREGKLENTLFLAPEILYPIALSWSHDGSAIYFSGIKKNNKDALTKAIFSFDLIDKRLRQITFPYVKGGGDHKASSSNNGQYLAVFRSTGSHNDRLLIFDLKQKKLAHDVNLNFKGSTLVWPEDKENTLIISGFYGDLAYFNLKENRLTVQPDNSPGLNDAFYACGDNCVFMRRHHLNYLDIVEVPNPFYDGPASPKLRLSSELVESQPLYGPDGQSIYYVSQDKSHTYLNRQALDGKHIVLHQFDIKGQISDLAINASEHYLSGKYKQRLFLFNIQTNQITWLTSTDEQIAFPTWNKTGEKIYYSRQIQNTSQLLSYTPDTETFSEVESGVLGYFESQQGQVIKLRDNNRLEMDSGDKSAVTLTTIPRFSIEKIQIHQGFIYWVANHELDIYLYRLDLETLKIEQKRLLRNGWMLSFSLHPQGHSVLLPKSLLADSDLVRVEW